eukprot:1195779-Prorocentrum_minimum.AAC.3
MLRCANCSNNAPTGLLNNHKPRSSHPRSIWAPFLFHPSVYWQSLVLVRLYRVTLYHTAKRVVEDKAASIQSARRQSRAQFGRPLGEMWDTVTNSNGALHKK